MSKTKTGTPDDKKEDPDKKKEGAPGLGWEDLTKAGAAVTALAAVLGTLAVAGVLEQVERNHSETLDKAIRFVVIAGVVWALAGVLKALAPRWERSFVVLNLVVAVLFAIGLVHGIRGLILAQQDSQRPSIAAVLKNQSGLTLEGTVKVGGLRSDDHLRVIVEGITWGGAPNDRADPTELKDARLYESWLGPNESGDVEHAINLPLSAVVGRESQDEIGIRAWVVPALSKSCDDEAFRKMSQSAQDDCSEYMAPKCYDRPARGSAGCIRLRIPRSQSGPQLAANWDGMASTLVLKVQAGGVRADSGVVSVHVFGDAAKKRRLLAVSRLRPDASGKVDSAWKVPIDRHYGPICAVAAIATEAGELGKATCPPRNPTLTAWVRLPRSSD